MATVIAGQPTAAAPGYVTDPAAWKMQTRRSRMNLQSLTSLTAFAQTATRQLSPVGLLANVYLQVYGTITFPSSPTGELSPYWPGNLLQSLRLFSGSAAEIYNTDGAWNQEIQALRHGIAKPLNPGAFGGSNRTNQGNLPAVLGTSPLGGAPVPSGAQNVSVMYRIPVSTDDDQSRGLIMMQDDAARLNVSIQLCNAADVVLNSSDKPTAISLTAKLVQEFYTIPPRSGNNPVPLPNLQWVHRWTQSQQPWSGTGWQTYRYVPGPVFLRSFVEFQQANASANRAGTQPAPLCGAAGDAGGTTAPNLTDVQLMYGGTTSPENYDWMFEALLYERQYGKLLPDGCVLFDWAVGGAGPDLRFDARDSINSQRLTDLAVRLNWAGSAPPSGSNLRVITEELDLIVG